VDPVNAVVRMKTCWLNKNENYIVVVIISVILALQSTEIYQSFRHYTNKWSNIIMSQWTALTRYNTKQHYSNQLYCIVISHDDGLNDGVW